MPSARIRTSKQTLPRHHLKSRKSSHSAILDAGRACGYKELRPGQEEALSALIAGHDVLTILPTGAGKSAIYQVAQRLLDGPCLVVSPLLALQKDQLEAITRSDLGNAALLNSALPAA